MPRNGSGQYTVPAGTLAVTDTDISSSAYNAFIADLSAALTNSVNVQGTAPMLASFNAGGFSMTNLGAGVNPTDAATLAQAQQAIPSGSVFWFAANTAPAGFLECNGGSMSTTTFATLFAAIGFTFGGSGASFNVPDLRGKFIRGWDHGAGIDTPGGVAQITGFISGTTLTVSSVIGGAVATGQLLSGVNSSGTTILSGTTISSGSGSSWVVNHSQTIGSSGTPIEITLSVSPTARVFGSFEPDITGPHGHTVTDPGHNHTLTDPGHLHAINDQGHTHAISDPGHSHTVTAALPSGNANGGSPLFGAASNSLTTNAAATGIGINAAGTGILIDSHTTGVTIASDTTGLTVNNIFTQETIVKNVALMACIKT